MLKARPMPNARPMQVDDLRIALFSGNYNYVRDGANQALNRLVGHLLDRGAKVRVYSPTIPHPPFEATGDIVSIPSIPIPGRGEYRIGTSLSPGIRADLAAFHPNILHISSPDYVAHRAVSWARERELPVLASVHTRFETYPRYYGLGFIEPLLVKGLRRLYNRCDALVAPSPSMADVLREEGMNDDVGIWSRGVDRDTFNPGRRDMTWRRAQGIADDMPVIGFLGRLVMEKGLDVFADAVAKLRDRGVAHHVLVVGEGPARDWFAERLPGACFTGFQKGADLARAVASMDMLFNPSITETFGNVTLECMACGVPTVAARATGSESLVRDGVSGVLVEPGDLEGFADALERYCRDTALRARHGAAGSDRAEEFDWYDINESVAQKYVDLIAAHG